MSENTKIEWTEDTINPIRARNKVTGVVGHYCVKVSPGCRNCYAERLQDWPIGSEIRYAAQDRENVELFLDGKVLEHTLRRKKPRRIFVCSMTDLFGEFVSDEFIDEVFAMMARAHWHTFQILTKRADRMLDYLSHPHAEMNVRDAVKYDSIAETLKWPLPNVQLGVSVEDQERADERIPLLLLTPAAVLWISAEPLLGKILLVDPPNDMGEPRFSYLERVDGQGPRIDWVVAGGESGPGARPIEAAWVRSLRDQCARRGVPFFFKQWGAWLPPAQSSIDGDTLYVNGSPNPLKFGKKKAGRMLDGRTHDEYPR